MASEKLESTYTVTGSILEVTPSKMADNSIYQIRLSGITSLDGTKTYPPKIFTITTAMSPMYCTLASLKAVTGTFDISDQDMLSYIRDASKYADFVAGGTAVKTGQSVPFAVEQFTRTKATLDCLLRTYMSNTTSGAGSTYTLGDATITESANSTSFKNLISALKDALKKWTDAIRGYYNEGHAKPKATRIGIKASENSDVSQITVDTILNDFTRSVVQYS